MSNVASVTCNLVYGLFSSPSWSNNCDIELILSDIPFIAVGILAFGLSILFLAIRRFTFSVVSLYSSVLLSFIAAIIDLTQSLAQDLNHATVLVTTREILLAMSLGLRFLFYWLYVSEPPIGEQRPRSFQIGFPNFLSPDRTDEHHCGNWARWGIAGCYARFALLATIVAITALQIIWRVFQRYHNYSPVYAADITLEVVVSVILLLKLLFNTVSSSLVPRTYSFKECSFTAIALVFNIGISIGGLFQFAFTESIVGRLLQGIELYILMVFMTICHLFRHKTAPNLRGFAMRKVELPEQLRASTFRLSPPVVSTPSLSTPLSPRIQGRSNNADSTRHSYRASVGCAIPRIPWRVSHIQSDQEEDRAKLWDQGEKGNIGPPDVNLDSVGHQRVASTASAMDEESTCWRGIVNDSISYSPVTAASGSLSVNAMSKDGSLNNKHGCDAIRVSKRSLGLRPMSLVAVPTTVTSSNERGAAVIMTAPPDPPTSCELDNTSGQPPTPNWKHTSGTSFDQFKELQNELDRIITTLRQFSPRSPISPTPTSSSKSDSNNDRQMLQPSTAARQSSSTCRQSFSTLGARSDFSLSNFPDPPRLPSQAPSLPTLLPAHSPRLKEGRRARLVSRQVSSPDILSLPPPPRIPAALTDVPSSPHSDITSDSPYQSNKTLPAVAQPPRVNSGGTQYEITSFILGDLTIPDDPGSPMSGMSPDEFREKIAGAMEESRSSPHIPTTLRSSPLRVTTPSGSISSSDPNSQWVEPTVQREMRPPMLPSMTVSPSPRSQPSSISSNARPPRTMFGLPPRPRFRARKPLLEGAQAPRAFELPRPPQVILCSDDEYSANRAE